MQKNEAIKMLDGVLELVEANYPGFTVKMSTKRYMEDGQISFKMEITDNAVKSSIDEKDCEFGMLKNGLNMKAIGFEFSMGDNTYIVESCKNRRMKYPVLAKNIRDGKMYKFTASSINARMSQT